MPDIEIHDNPKLKTLLRSLTEMSFTGIIWVLWIYIFLPILNVVFWLIGIRYFHLEVIEQVGYLEMIDLINKMAVVVLIVFIIMRVWGYYNYWRFGKKERRRNNSSLDIELLASQMNISVEEIKSMQSKKEFIWPDSEYLQSRNSITK